MMFIYLKISDLSVFENVARFTGKLYWIEIDLIKEYCLQCYTKMLQNIVYNCKINSVYICNS